MAENLGDSFYAYIYNPNLQGYLNCGNITTAEVGQVSGGNFVDTSKTDADVTTATLSAVTGLTDTTRQQQENYWKFERNADGSYTINSSNVQYAVMNAYADGTVKTVKKIATADIGTDYASVYSQRWFIRKYGTSYKLEAKGNGKVLDFTSADSITYTANTETSFGDASVKQLCDIIKTDCSIDTEMPNVKINLFDYGKSINTYANAVLPFTNGENNKDAYVDGESGEAIGTTGRNTPAGYNTNVRMKSTLVNGYPEVTDNGRKYYKGKWSSSVVKDDGFKQDASGNAIKGSLEYLFNPNFGGASGYVQGNSTNSVYTKGDNLYQSQYFEVESPKGLFRINPDNGMYYYDSLLGSAYFQRNFDSNGKLSSNKGSFKLYDYTTSINKADYRNNSKNSTTGLNLVSGNFFPFNLSCEEGDVFYGKERGDDNSVATSLDIGPRRRVKSDSDKQDVIKNGYVNVGDMLPVNYRLTNSNTGEKINAWFGMTMELNFQMTKDGSFNGKDMVYKFKGDDDVWVYIDDVLVLDMGGTHEAQTGTINFKTGAVEYTHNVDVTDSTVVKQEETVQTDLYTLFSNVGKTDDFDTNTKTFKSQSNHTLKFFYLERGGYVSGCQMQFNLPKGLIGVSKKVEGLDSELKDPRTYTFQLQGADGNPFTSTNKSDLTQLTYLYEKVDGTTEEKVMPIGNGNDCKFTLKDGESVIFNDMPDGDQYKIVELDPPSGTNVSSTVKQGTDGATNYNNGTVLTADSSKFSQITYSNAIPTNSLKLVTKVLDPDDYEVDEMPNSTYYLGLRIFDNDGNDYGTKLIPVSGATELNKEKVLSGLPSGATYELWEYVPDDTNNRYEAPKLSDANGTQNYTARFVETGSTPALNDVISGSVSGQTLTVVNKLLASNSISVTFKYYDRKINNGEPANIDSKETSYSKLVDLTDSAYKSFVTDEYKINNKAIFGKMITEVGADATTNGAIDNVVDSYDLFTSQNSAKNAVTGYTYTIGKSDNYATHNISADEAVYHTNSKRQPLTDPSEQDKWVTYYKSGTIVDPETDGSVDLDKITGITVWLYNKPKTYTVTTHVFDGNGNKKQIEFSAYYNQQLGVYGDFDENGNVVSNDKDECFDYCERYSIPLKEYDARGKNKLTPDTDTTYYESAGALSSFYITPTVQNIGASEDGNYSVTSNKKVYSPYEDIKITANSNDYSEDQDWVGIYKKGETDKRKYLDWYYLSDVGNGAERNIKNGCRNNYVLSEGEYTLVLYSDSGYDNNKASIDITVINKNTPSSKNEAVSEDSNYSVSTAKKIFFLNEDINVTASSKLNTNKTDWVGIYQKGETDYSNYLNYYYLTDAGDNKAYNIKAAEHKKGEIAPGEYTIVIFSDNGYTKKASIDITVVDKQDFSYWTDSEANGNILSVERSYLYRITRNMDLYANYGKGSAGKGVVSTNEGIDVYYDTNGTKKLRLNTMMNPYGFAFGKISGNTVCGNTNIKYASAAYLTFTDSSNDITNVKGGVDGIKATIKTTAGEIADAIKDNSYTKASKTFNVTNENGDVIGAVKVIVYKTNNGELLTNKNRLQFAASYTAPTGENVKKVLAFTSLYYNDGKENSTDNGWYVSDNYVTHTMTSNIGVSQG